MHPSGAQTLQSLVIGGEVAVAVPPRGATPPLASPAPMPLVAPAPLGPLPSAALPLANGGGVLGALGLGGVPGAALLPLAAAALGGALPGAGGGGSGPARTR